MASCGCGCDSGHAGRWSTRWGGIMPAARSAGVARRAWCGRQGCCVASGASGEWTIQESVVMWNVFRRCGFFWAYRKFMSICVCVYVYVCLRLRLLLCMRPSVSCLSPCLWLCTCVRVHSCMFFWVCVCMWSRAILFVGECLFVCGCGWSFCVCIRLCVLLSVCVRTCARAAGSGYLCMYHTYMTTCLRLARIHACITTYHRFWLSPKRTHFTAALTTAAPSEQVNRVYACMHAREVVCVYIIYVIVAVLNVCFLYVQCVGGQHWTKFICVYFLTLLTCSIFLPFINGMFACAFQRWWRRFRTISL